MCSDEEMVVNGLCEMIVDCDFSNSMFSGCGICVNSRGFGHEEVYCRVCAEGFVFEASIDQCREECPDDAPHFHTDTMSCEICPMDSPYMRLDGACDDATGCEVDGYVVDP